LAEQGITSGKIWVTWSCHLHYGEKQMGGQQFTETEIQFPHMEKSTIRIYEIRHCVYGKDEVRAVQSLYLKTGKEL
jgi:hypothetical protein